MRKCNKRLLAVNGNSRGRCERGVRHRGRCANRRCWRCGIGLTKKTAAPSIIRLGCGLCSRCNTEHKRFNGGHGSRNFQTARHFHRFPCGCSGILPSSGKSNVFAYWCGKFRCRVSIILLRSSRSSSKKRGYKSIDATTSHSLIRKLMKEKNCVLCQQPLKWKLGLNVTPHLHHNHGTGRIIGFAHPVCNWTNLKRRVLELEAENQNLKNKLAVVALPKAA